jgi:hypothetical protein
MPTKVRTSNFSAGDVSVDSTRSYTADAADGREVSLPVGKAVTSWVKTDADTAGCNLPTGHGYTNGNFDVYWEESGVAKRRYGVPGTITGDAIALNGGAGDNFPASSTTGIVVTKQVQVNMSIYDTIVAIAIMLTCPSGSESSSKGHVHFSDDSAFDIHMDLLGNSDVFQDSVSNDWTSPTTTIYASNGSDTVLGTLKVAVLQDSTP